MYRAGSFRDTGRESAHTSAHRFHIYKDQPRGGAETSVWQPRVRQTPVRGTSASHWTRSVIGPARRPIRSRRCSQGARPSTRAECTQESKAGQSCCAARALFNRQEERCGMSSSVSIRTMRSVKASIRYFFLLCHFKHVVMQAVTGVVGSDKRRSSHMFMHGAAPHLPAASTCIMQQGIVFD